MSLSFDFLRARDLPLLLWNNSKEVVSCEFPFFFQDYSSTIAAFLPSFLPLITPQEIFRLERHKSRENGTNETKPTGQSAMSIPVFLLGLIIPPLGTSPIPPP